MNKKIKVEFEISTEATSNEALSKQIEKAILSVAPTLISKIDVQFFEWEPDGMFKESIKSSINSFLENQGWIYVGDNNENIPFDDVCALFYVYSPLCDLSNYGTVDCYRLAVMTTEGRGGVTHFKPIKGLKNE